MTNKNEILRDHITSTTDWMDRIYLNGIDKSQNPHMRADELCAWFGVAASTGGNKAKQNIPTDLESDF